MTGWPLTFNGVTYNEADFAGNKYADSLPRLLRDVAAHVAQFSKSLSATSLAVAASGDVTIAVAPNKNYAEGQPIRIARTSDPAGVWMTGACLSYDVSTGAMTVRRSSAAGSGTYADWTVSVDGGAGQQGSTGATGPAPVTVTTSSAALTIGLGSTGSFALAATTDLGLGSPVLIAMQSDTGKHMFGLITAKSGVNVSVNVLAISGSGSSSAWFVALCGSQGIQGATGPTAKYLGTTSGSATAFTASGSDYTSNADGNKVAIKLHTANGAAPTYADGALAARPMLDIDGAAIGSGVFGASTILELRFSSSFNGWVVNGYRPVSGFSLAQAHATALLF
jgi:hypothetical protein